jgi:tetrahydromethanopterin S-methyltransferase subunit A
VVKREGDNQSASEEKWPIFRGDYVIGDPESRVAVVTLAAHIDVIGASIFGPCKTENLGVEKVVANLISNPNIRFLLICGRESKGHLPGDAIAALHRNGIDKNGKILGAKGAIPFIQNIPPEAISRFQDQIEIIERIGLEDVGEINKIVKEHKSRSEPYPEDPFLVVKPRPKRYDMASKSGFCIEDVIFGLHTALDASAWLVTEESQRIEESQISQEEEIV